MERRTSWVDLGSNFLGQDDPVVHVGLGSHSEAVDLVEVRWPKTGRVQFLRDVGGNQRLTVHENVATCLHPTKAKVIIASEPDRPERARLDLDWQLRDAVMVWDRVAGDPRLLVNQDEIDLRPRSSRMVPRSRSMG